MDFVFFMMLFFLIGHYLSIGINAEKMSAIS